MPDTLRVRAVGDTLVPRFDLPTMRRFVGRTPVFEAGKPTEWPPTAEPTEVPATAEFIHALKAGDLEPADEATAKRAGVAWAAPAPVEVPVDPPAPEHHVDIQDAPAAREGE